LIERREKKRKKRKEKKKVQSSPHPQKGPIPASGKQNTRKIAPQSRRKRQVFSRGPGIERPTGEIKGKMTMGKKMAQAGQRKSKPGNSV